jgi:hypothetical protein
MNLPKFELLKRFFTSKKSTSEVEVLRAQVRMLQNALSVEEEHHKHTKNILFSIIEVESVELPLPMVLEIFDYLHMDAVEDLLK